MEDKEGVEEEMEDKVGLEEELVEGVEEEEVDGRGGPSKSFLS